MYTFNLTAKRQFYHNNARNKSSIKFLQKNEVQVVLCPSKK